MRYRKFGRTGWNVSEVGCGMWGMAGWTGSEEGEVAKALDRAIELGCNFFDTAWAYGEGKSEEVLSQALRRYPASSYTWQQRFPRRTGGGPPCQTISWRKCFLLSTL